MNSLSVVITCFREGNLIYDALESILNQSLLPREIIIVNDASTDIETNKVCQELTQNPLIKVIWRENNGGTSIARNNGFQVAQGDILVPLDADDLLPNNALELISKTFEQNQKAGFIYGKYIRQDESALETKIIDPGDISLEVMLKAKRFSLNSNWKLLGATPIRRSLWQSIGGYDADFGILDLHDVEFWMRVIASDCQYYYIPEVIYIWRKYLGSNSRQVTPLSWSRIVKKHFAIYQKVNLIYRAYQLLLLGSKWSNNIEEIKLYSTLLKETRPIKLSSVFILIIPSSWLQFLTKIVIKKR